MRLDRTLTLLVNYLGYKKRQRSVPVLMYHSVSPVINKNVNQYYCTEITPEKFETHLNYLVSERYKTHYLKDIKKILSNNSHNSKDIIITFDDGYFNFFKYVLPLLKKFNIYATVFIPSGLIGKHQEFFEGQQLMDWTQIKECSQQWVDIGSHSLTHSKLVNCRGADLEMELKESKEIIEKNIQKQVSTFSFPFRFPEGNKNFTSKYCYLLKKYGYQYGVTTRIGCTFESDDAHLLKRIPVNQYDDIRFFRAKLNGSYDWLYNVQFLYKVIQKIITNSRK